MSNNTMPFAAIQRGNKQFNLVCDSELSVAQVKRVMAEVSGWLQTVDSLYDGPQHTIRIWAKDSGFATSIDVETEFTW